MVTPWAMANQLAIQHRHTRTPLNTGIYDTDKAFRQKIVKYMFDEEVAKWAI